MTSSGTVDLSWVEEHAEKTPRSCCVGWKKLLVQAFGSDLQSVSLIELFRRCAGHAEIRSLLYQLAWHLSLQLDVSLAGQVTGKNTHARVVFKWSELKDIMADPDASSHRLAEYVMEGAEMTIGHPVFSISTDNASVKGLMLQNSLIVLPNNLAILCCPCVPRLYLCCVLGSS
jgi:hypothetical protein